MVDMGTGCADNTEEFSYKMEAIIDKVKSE